MTNGPTSARFTSFTALVEALAQQPSTRAEAARKGW